MTYLLTALMAFLLGFALSLSLTDEKYTLGNNANKQIIKCEKTLPRNQHCIINAIPDVPKQEDLDNGKN